MKRAALGLSVGLILGCLTLAPCSMGAEKITIRLGTLAPEGSPWHDVLKRMDQEWRRISGGKVSFKIYSGVLGDEAEMIRKMNRRQLQAVAISGAGLPRIENAVSCFAVPLMLENYDELDYVRDRMAPRLEALFEKKGYKVLNWVDAGWVHFFTKKPAATPDALRSLKLMISAGDPENEKLYEDFGLTVVPLPYTEVLVGLETGLIEAVQGPPLFAMLDQWFGIATYMTDMKWLPLVGATVMQRDTWEKIPAEWRPQMLESARKAGSDLRATIRRLGEEAVPEMQKRGLNVVPVDLELWRTKTVDAYPKLRGRFVAAELFDEVQRLRDEHRSANSGSGSASE